MLLMLKPDVLADMQHLLLPVPLVTSVAESVHQTSGFVATSEATPDWPLAQHHRRNRWTTPRQGKDILLQLSKTLISAEKLKQCWQLLSPLPLLCYWTDIYGKTTQPGHPICSPKTVASWVTNDEGRKLQFSHVVLEMSNQAECHHHHHFWQVPLRVRSAEQRHQSPEWTVLSQVNCVVHIKVTRFQILLNGFHPCNTRTSQWSHPVSCGGSC